MSGSFISEIFLITGFFALVVAFSVRGLLPARNKTLREQTREGSSFSDASATGHGHGNNPAFFDGGDSGFSHSGADGGNCDGGGGDGGGGE